MEVQGEVLGNLTGPLGQLTVTGKAAVLEIGQHVLDGEVVTLKQPLLVVEKGEAVGLAGVVRTKLVFRSRPKTKRSAGSLGP